MMMNIELKFSGIAYLLSFILLAGMLSGCSNKNIDSNKQGSTKITPKEAKRRLDDEKDIILLDVRTNEEYNAGHIKDSILIPVDELEQKAEKNLADKDDPVFVYCRSGNRSASAAKILVKLGYKNVFDLGGINNWPYEVVK
jgi:phage shock protein E